MTILLDTNAWLWMTFASKRLGRRSKAVLENPDQRLLLSVASAWEVVIKAALGKLAIPGDAARFVRATLERQRIASLTISLDHVLAVEHLPKIHRDPFDRLIIAQASFEGMKLMSADLALRAYPVDFLDAHL